MRRVLHILTKAEDALAQEVISRQRDEAQYDVEIVDLTAPDRDYRRLLEQIFEADSVEVW